MAPILSFLISSGSKKEPRYIRLCKAKSSHSHKMWTEVSSSVPHFLQVGLLLSPITHKCLLKVLCPVRRPITTLNWILLKDNNRALVATLGPEINSRACLCVLQGPRHNIKCWFSIHNLIFLLMFCLETPRKAKFQQIFEQYRLLRSCRLFNFLVIQHVQGPGIALSVPVRDSFKAFWHCRTNWNAVLVAWSAYRAAWLTEQTLTYLYFTGLSWVSNSWTQANVSLKNSSILSYRDAEPSSYRLPIDPSPGPLRSPGPICKTNDPFNRGRSPRSSGPLISSLHSNPIFVFQIKTGLITSTPILNMGSDFWRRLSILLCPRGDAPLISLHTVSLEPVVGDQCLHSTNRIGNDSSYYL